jgi:hypothetical protein
MTDDDRWAPVWDSWSAYLTDLWESEKFYDMANQRMDPDTLAIVAAILTLAERIPADAPVFSTDTP